MPRIPKDDNWPVDQLNQVVQGDALERMRELPDECVALAVTSPPYWNVKDYGMKGQIGQSSYEAYIDQLVEVWEETRRVLIPNGKLAIVTPIMPIEKAVIGDQHTRHLKNISADIEASILREISGLNRYSLFVWKKQTTTKMFGSYPFPPNLYEDNTIEFISVFVKDGKPPSLPKPAKEPSKLTQEEWRNLTMQVWPMYPEDVRRSEGHPAPFPVVLPQRLILMNTFKRAPDHGFEGDLVLDMFNGTGATCIAAKATGRNYLGIDLNPEYCEAARRRLKTESVDPYQIVLEEVRVKGPKDSRQLEMFDSDDGN